MSSGGTLFLPSSGHRPPPESLDSRAVRAVGVGEEVRTGIFPHLCIPEPRTLDSNKGIKMYFHLPEIKVRRGWREACVGWGRTISDPKGNPALSDATPSGPLVTLGGGAQCGLSIQHPVETPTYGDHPLPLDL